MKHNLSKAFRVFLCFALVCCVLSASSLPLLAVSGNFKESTTKAAVAMAKEIEAEGIVMLKNEDNSLPLTGDKKVNVFGVGASNFALGGGGSGSVSTDGAIMFYDALDNAGIQYNEELRERYNTWADLHSLDKTGLSLIDMAIVDSLNSSLASEMAFDQIENFLNTGIIQNAIDYSENAILVISRTGAELDDLDPEAGSIQLSEAELGLVENLNNYFSNVIVIFNTCNILQMDWIEQYENVKSVLLCWTTGEVAADSIGKVLTGEINPSGKLTDTVAYTIDDYPSTVNFGDFKYKGEILHFVNYQEGIYVGYRFFETFEDARDKVQFPFGYGLSYTTFKWDVTDYKATANKISVTVKVTNTGDVAGKDVVQVYFSAPYYPDRNIEKSVIELAGYKKTALIQPGQSDTVTVEFKTADMASYDQKGEQAWVLDEGDYQIKVGHDVRTFEKVFTYNVPSRKVMKTDDRTGAEIKNLFDQAAGSVDYLSREDTHPYEKLHAPTDADYEIPESCKFTNIDTRPDPQTEGTAPTTGARYDKTIMLEDVAQDDSLWDAFLDQFTVGEMLEMITGAGYGTPGLSRLGVPETDDNDGPSMAKGPGGLTYTEYGISYPSPFCLASTWNDELQERFGQIIGEECVEISTEMWYAPACNLHRSPMGGRCFEYYSEDPLLSGKVATAVTKGVQSKGVVVTVKHFVANDQETNRLMRGLVTWLNEQSLRELYLEPFEICIKEGNARGVMTAYNRLGSEWCTGYPALCQDLLRTEWGFDGFAISDAYIDFTGGGYMDPVLAIYSRNSLLTGLWHFLEAIQEDSRIMIVYANDPIGFGKALRDCTYDLCRLKIQTVLNKQVYAAPDYGIHDDDDSGNAGGTTPTSADTNKEPEKIVKTGGANNTVIYLAAVTLLSGALVTIEVNHKKRKATEK